MLDMNSSEVARRLFMALARRARVTCWRLPLEMVNQLFYRLVCIMFLVFHLFNTIIPAVRRLL